jgi:hypothetical protein
MTNEEVLRRLHKDRELLAIIKLGYLGHMLLGPKCRLLQGKVEGKGRLGRKNLFWLRNIRNWTRLSVEELVRIVADRERFEELVGSIA